MAGLADLRVIEVAGGVGVAYAAKLLADLGADVIRVEGPDDLVRRRPFEVHRWLNTNKRSHLEPADGSAVDTPDDRAWRTRLLPGADLVIHDGSGLESLLDEHPSLVVGTLSPYGRTGPWADQPGAELTVMHASSWGFLSPAAAPDIELPPLKAPGHHATVLTATVAATAFLAAVDAARRTGVGEHVDFSAFAAGAKMSETAPVSAAFQGVDASRVGVRTLIPWSMYQCRDGLLQFICVEESQWTSLVELMGDPEWASLEVFATNADRQDNVDLVELYVSEWMTDQSAAELFLEGQDRRLCTCPVYRMDQLPHDEQLRSRGFFATDPDGRLLPGPGFKIDRDWWGLRRSAPEPGQHDDEGWLPRSTARASRSGGDVATESAPEPGPVASAPSPGTLGRPLEGIRVCDFTWIWAGPYCTQLLAHLGADVVRIESPDHLCLLRRLPFNPPDLDLTPDTAGVFQIYNSDKRSVAIDLGIEAAREIVDRMVAGADVVIDNFAVGTLAGLGYPVERIRELNPDAVVVSLTGYGQDGPYADYMAYGPCGGAFAGLYAANGYEDGPAMETGVAIGDPGTGLTAAWATVAALTARHLHGEVARVDVAMVEAIAATVGELWMQYQATGESPGPLGNHDPQWAPHNVYATGPDEWLALACTDDEQYRALVGIAPDEVAAVLVHDRFATEAGRKEHEAELDQVVAAWLAGADRSSLLAALAAAGVPAAPSLSPLALWGGDGAHDGNEQLAAIGMLECPDHPATGVRVVPGIPWRLQNRPNGLRRAAPALGQHTDEVLAELGFGGADIERLTATGALPGREPS
jgi:crotonobetainyl-CoA:carnitine CoA-transferase CaiB-like acyl-CoA transferase